MKSFSINTLVVLALSLAGKSMAKDTCNNGYDCCPHCNVILEENGVFWGAQNGEWCEIPTSCNIVKDDCFSSPLYPCCSTCTEYLTDSEGSWGYENDSWCGLKETCKAEDPDVEVIEDGIVMPDSPYIYYVGRWDDEYFAQWANSGFKIDFSGTSFKLVTGGKSCDIITSGYSLDYGDIVYLNITKGENVLVKDIPEGEHSMRFWTSSLEQGFIQLDHLEIDAGAKVHKYKPQDKYMQVLGDSMSCGMYLPNEALDSYSFLLGQYLNVEMDVFATSGICLTDTYCYSKERGLSFQYFQMQNVEALNWGYTEVTPVDFSKTREPDYMIINIGTNDMTTKSADEDQIRERMVDFVTAIRKVYPNTVIMVANYYGNFWLKTHEDIGSHFENVYFIDVNSDIVCDAPDIIPFNGHFTQIGTCKAAKGLVEKMKEMFGFEPIGWRSENWGHNTGVAPATMMCEKEPHDHTFKYHYSYEGFGGVGAW